MDLTNLDQLGKAKDTTVVEGNHTARVVRVNASGVFVVPLGEDIDFIVGPCRGQVPDVGDIVLLVHTQERPWILT